MEEKDTASLLNELKKESDMDAYTEKNAQYLKHPSYHEFLTSIMGKKGLKISDIQKKAGLTSYVYEVLRGKKKHPSKKVLLALALTIGLNFEDARHLLLYAKAGNLYVKNWVDRIYIFAITQKLNIDDTNELLTNTYENFTEAEQTLREKEYKDAILFFGKDDG